MSQGYYSKIRAVRLRIEEQNLVTTSKTIRARAERAHPIDMDKQEKLYCDLHRKHVELTWGDK